VFGFITLTSYIYIYIYLHNVTRRLTQFGDFHRFRLSDSSSQLDSPTAERLNADWLSRLAVGRIFRQLKKFNFRRKRRIYVTCNSCQTPPGENFASMDLYVDFAYGIYSREKFATLFVVNAPLDSRALGVWRSKQRNNIYLSFFSRNHDSTDLVESSFLFARETVIPICWILLLL